jgi:parallel beta-helix repeat protein
MHRRDLPKALFATALGAVVVPATSQAQTQGEHANYPQSQQEASAGVTPRNYAFPPGDVRRYGALLNGANDVQALQDAINGSNEVFGIVGVLTIGWPVILRSGVTIRGEGSGASTIRAATGSFSLLHDDNAALSDICIRDLTLAAAAIGSSNRGILFDADSAAVTTNVTVERCHFTSLFRGIEADRIDNLRVRDCEFSGLTSVGVYVGATNSTGRSTKITIIGSSFRRNGGPGTEGGVIVAYADEVATIGNHFENIGASSGATNLYAAAYYRAVTLGSIANNTFRVMKRGAGIHVYADTSAGEARCRDISVIGNVIENSQDYVGIRIDSTDDLIVSDNTVSECFANGIHISNGTGVTISGNILRDNNMGGNTGTAAGAAVRLANVDEFSITGNVAREARAGGSAYAQGAFVRFEGICADGSVCSNIFKFPVGAGGNGYYFCDADGAVDRVCFTGNVQRGASSFFKERSLCKSLTFLGNIVSNNGNPEFLTLAQLHKFPARANLNQGKSVSCESDGMFVTARLSSLPTSGSWTGGDVVWRTTPSAGFAPGYVCTASGTAQSWKKMASLEV